MRIPVKLRRQVSVTQFCTALSSGLVAKMEEAKYAAQEKVNSIFGRSATPVFAKNAIFCTTYLVQDCY